MLRPMGSLSLQQGLTTSAAEFLTSAFIAAGVYALDRGLMLDVQNKLAQSLAELSCCLRLSVGVSIVLCQALIAGLLHLSLSA